MPFEALARRRGGVEFGETPSASSVVTEHLRGRRVHLDVHGLPACVKRWLVGPEIGGTKRKTYRANGVSPALAEAPIET